MVATPGVSGNDRKALIGRPLGFVDPRSTCSQEKRDDGALSVSSPAAPIMTPWRALADRNVEILVMVRQALRWRYHSGKVEVEVADLPAAAGSVAAAEWRNDLVVAAAAPGTVVEVVHASRIPVFPAMAAEIVAHPSARREPYHSGPSAAT